MPPSQEPQPETQLAPPLTAAADAARDACLIHIYPPGPTMGRRYPVTGPLLIGRTEECEVWVTDTSVSRRHARVEPAAGGYRVEDLGSTNGTYVNDRPVRGPAELADGDSVRVGNCLYRFLAGGNVEAGYHEEIYRLTVQDTLTGAHNRRALMEFLDREASRSRRYARPLSVVLFDVDHFKRVNDEHGHLGGDRVLRGVADRVRAGVRAEDLFARYGGEEFALVLIETAHPAAVAAAGRLREMVGRQVFEVGGQPVRVTVSAGVATTCGDPGIEPGDLLKAADDRLYAAKRAGRDRVVGEEEPAEADAANP